MKRILFLLVLCLGLLSCRQVINDNEICEKYQDVARVDIVRYLNSNIDSIVMKVNDSIIGCIPSKVSYDNMIGPMRIVGSITHRIAFPINVRLQFFSKGDLRREYFFEMDKNTVARVYKDSDCPNYVDSSLDDYCWFIGNIVEDPYAGCADNHYSDICTVDTRPLR